MIYALKLLFVVLLVCGLAGVGFRSAFRNLLTPADYRHAWRLVAITSIAVFLCKFPALFLLALAVIAVQGRSPSAGRESGAFAVYLLLAVIVPPISFGIGGIGGINYFLQLDPYRVLALALLLVPALRLASARGEAKRGSLLAIDLCIVGYEVYQIALSVPYSSATTIARSAVVSALDTLLPYYVATRSIRTMADLRQAGAYLMIGLLFAGSVAVAECLTQRNLYSGLQGIYGIRWQLTYQLMRGGLLRVQAMTPQPILLAMAMTCAIGLWIWLKGSTWRQGRFMMGFAVLMVALVGTWSRGPWLGCGVLFLMLLLMYWLPASAVRMLLVLMVVGALGIKAVGADTAVASGLASFFGGSKDEQSTIDYRRQLLDTSLALIRQSPWFGVPNYAAQMQDLKQGEGIIDLVNSYIAIMLNTGVTGLVLFLAPFVILIQRMLGAIRREDSGRLSSGSRFAIVFVAMNIAFLFAIFTTSTFGILHLLLVMLVALPAAWLAMPAPERDAASPIETEDKPTKGLPARYGYTGLPGA